MPVNATTLADLTDEQLARQTRAGCSSSFEHLVRRFQVPLLRYLLRRLPRRADAEDVLQESFLRAYQSIHQYREAWPFRTWMFTITRRLAINHLRKLRPTENPDQIDHLPDSAEPPSHALGLEEQRHRIWHTARAILNADQFETLWLYYVEEMSAGDIARVLGRSWVGIKTLLHRARKRLLPHLAFATDSPPEPSPSTVQSTGFSLSAQSQPPPPTG